MKPRIVEYDAKSAKPERAVGDAPRIGPVAKVSEVEAAPRKATGKRRHGGQSQGEQVDRLIRSLTVTVVVVVLLMLAVVVLVWIKRLIAPEHPSPVGGPAEVEVTGRDRGVLRLEEREALDLMRRALANRHVGRVAEHFRMGSTVSADEVVAFMEAMESRDGLVVGMEFQPMLWVEGQALGRVELVTRADGRRGRRLALLVHDEAFGWRIDFDAFARRVEPSWKELMEGDVAEGIVRVTVGGGDVEEEGWECWRLASPDQQSGIKGYCRVGSSQSQAMRALLELEAGGEERRVALVVGPLRDRGRGAFEIRRVIAADWVITSEAFDARFVKP